MSTALTLANNLAVKIGMGEVGQELIDTLKQTAFKGQATDAQFTALMIVANQYGLNPWTREIFAFPDKGSIVPVVGVDGWSRIINDHPQFDGMEFEQDNEQCTCIIFRKDRSHPVKTTEYLSECKRDTQPWKSHPKRMLRHKSLIQCARLAFGYTGIYDQDEAERIVEKDITPSVRKGAPQPVAVEIDYTEQARLIDLLELSAKNGTEAFKASWLALEQSQKGLVGIAERDRIKSLADAKNVSVTIEHEVIKNEAENG